MTELQIIMPMAGSGSRFREAGYSTPKPLIEVAGMAMFERSYASIVGPKRLVAVIRSEDNRQGLGAAIRKAAPGANIVVLEHDTKGPVETVTLAREAIDPALPAVILDCDMCFESAEYGTLVSSMQTQASDLAGVIPFHRSSEPRFSYAEVNDGYAVRVAEKKVISDCALIGAYAFRSYLLFEQAANELLASPPGALGEYYVSQVYSLLLARRMRVRALEAERYFSFGTPEELLHSVEAIKRSGKHHPVVR